MARWVEIGAADTPLGPGGSRPVEIDGHTIAIARRESGEWTAFDDTCTHEECSLSEGDVEGPWIVCYCHNAAFELETGAVVRGPAEDPIRVYPVREVDGQLEVEVDE